MRFIYLLFLFVTLKDSTPFECGVYRNKKRSDALFQDIRVLRLNCDKTFTFRHSNCINPDTSFGVWTQIDNTLILTTSKKLKKLVKKETKTSSGHAFVDFDNESMTIHDNILVWKRSDKFWVDTLYRQ